MDKSNRESAISRRTLVAVAGFLVSSIAGTGGGIAAVLAGRQSSADGSVESGWQTLDLKTSRYVTFPVSVNGQAVRAIVDTGATRSVVSSEWVGRLGLVPTGKAEATALTRALPGTVYAAASLEIGKIMLSDVRVAAFGESDSLASLTPYPLVLGLDVLSRVALRIQFPVDRMTVQHDENQIDLSRFSQIPLLADGRFLPTVSARLENTSDCNALIDLGSNVLCSMSQDFAERTLDLMSRRASTTMTAGVEGPVVGRLITIRAIDVGPFKFHDASVCILRDWKIEQPVNFGWPMFEAFDLVLRRRCSELWLAADDRLLAQPLQRDRSGIGAARLPDRLVVRHVGLHSPAEIEGLKVGDEIVAIDHRNIDPDYPRPGDRQGYKPAGTVLHLKLATGQEIVLTLRDYY